MVTGPAAVMVGMKRNCWETVATSSVNTELGTELACVVATPQGAPAPAVEVLHPAGRLPAVVVSKFSLNCPWAAPARAKTAAAVRRFWFDRPRFGPFLMVRLQRYSRVSGVGPEIVQAQATARAGRNKACLPPIWWFPARSGAPRTGLPPRRGAVSHSAAAALARAPGSGRRAASGELLEEAREVGDVEDRGLRRAVAVGVGVAGGELLKKAGEVGHVGHGRLGAAVAVGVAGAPGCGEAQGG